MIAFWPQTFHPRACMFLYLHNHLYHAGTCSLCFYQAVSLGQEDSLACLHDIAIEAIAVAVHADNKPVHDQ